MKNLYSTLFFLLTLLFSVLSGRAQDLKVDGLVTVEADALLYVEGDAVITSTGDIQNNGTIEITGDWENDRADGALNDNGSPQPGDQRLIRFIGSGAQQMINNNGDYLKFKNFETTNNATFDSIIVGGLNVPEYFPGTGLEAFDSIEVENLNLNGGDLIMSNFTLVIGAGSDISNFSSNNVIHFNNRGVLRRKYSSVVNTYEFPVHREDIGYVPTTVYFDNAPQHTVPGDLDHIDAKFISSLDDPNLSGKLGYVNRQWSCGNLLGAPGLQHISIDQMLEEPFGYWEITPFNGSNQFIGQASQGWQYDIRARIPNRTVKKFIADHGADYLKLIKIPSHKDNGAYIPFKPGDLFGSGNLWTTGIPNSSGRNLCDGLVTIVDFPGHAWPGNYDESTGLKAHDLNSFSRFGAGGNGDGAGLPIELIYIDAKPVDNSFIRVEWATAVEINNSGFQVLRSEDGVNFTQIGWVDGAGNTSEEQYYHFNDVDVEPNTLYYYKLNQVDYDGASEETRVVSAMIVTSDVFTISEFMPNPTMNSSRIEINTSEVKDINITLYNTLGQVIQTQDRDIDVGKNTIDFNVSALADGTYYAIIRVDEEILNRKLIITK